jgi:leucyl-tRNA synthetase
MTVDEASKAITEKFGRKKVTYKLREWVFSRQRYWGEPIPIIHFEKDGIVPVPEEQLPVQLPEVEHYEPTGTGESPLAAIEDWVNVQCPVCSGPAKRETNTMPQWAGSSWYYLRFMDPKNDAALVDPDKEKAWAPVDVYVGGDHAVRHLIYARFWHKFLYDIGVVSTIEPFARLEFLGFILAEDGRKMSKRYGNVINPDDVVSQVGADAFRLYEMFMGPFTQTVSWSTTGIQGPYRFIERVWRLGMSVKSGEDVQDSDALVSALHKTIKRVSEDTEGFRFNTAVAALMECLNDMEREKEVSRKTFGIFLQLLAPYAPHVVEELWEQLGNTALVCHTAWPEFDEAQTKQATTSIVVQVNGKVRGEIAVATDASQDEVEKMARAVENVSKYLEAGQVRKVIYVPNRLINFVCS